MLQFVYFCFIFQRSSSTFCLRRDLKMKTCLCPQDIKLPAEVKGESPSSSSGEGNAIPYTFPAGHWKRNDERLLGHWVPEGRSLL